MKMTDSLPLLRGVITEIFPWRNYPDKPGYQFRMAEISVWCPYCKRHHQHGWDPADSARVKSHRGAHCTEPGPFQETGYYISVWRRKDPEAKAHVCRPGKAIVRVHPRLRHLPACQRNAIQEAR